MNSVMIITNVPNFIHFLKYMLRRSVIFLYLIKLICMYLLLKKVYLFIITLDIPIF